MTNKANARLGIIETVLTSGRSARVPCTGLTMLNTEYNGLLSVRKKMLENLKLANPEKMVLGSVKLEVTDSDGKFIGQQHWRAWYFDKVDREKCARKVFYLVVRPLASGEEGIAGMEVEFEKPDGGYHKVGSVTAGEILDDAPTTDKEKTELMRDSLHTACQEYRKHTLQHKNPTAERVFRTTLDYFMTPGLEYEGLQVTRPMLEGWTKDLEVRGHDLYRMAREVGLEWLPQEQKPAAPATTTTPVTFEHERRATQILDGYGEPDEYFPQLLDRVEASEGTPVRLALEILGEARRAASVGKL